MTEDNKKLLEELSKTSYGKALREYLEESLKSISDINTCSSWEDTLARQKAVIVVRKLFSFMEEKSLDNKRKNQYR